MASVLRVDGAAMRIAFSDFDSAVPLVLHPKHPLTDDEYIAFCMANQNLNRERMPGERSSFGHPSERRPITAV